uniref:14-3-3 domain-containing protein n=1 Tax=Poecilia reticulata TaxID=8081 RepID=A0A3P9PPN1_POERE
MADRENLVYQAKLAEQAERYDGKAADTQIITVTAECCGPRSAACLSPCAAQGARSRRYRRSHGPGG